MYVYIGFVGFESFPRATHLSLVDSLSHQPVPSPHLIPPQPPSRGHSPHSSPLHRPPTAKGQTGARRGSQDEPDITGSTPSLAVCPIHRGALAYSILLWASSHHSKFKNKVHVHVHVRSYSVGIAWNGVSEQCFATLMLLIKWLPWGVCQHCLSKMKLFLSLSLSPSLPPSMSSHRVVRHSCMLKVRECAHFTARAAHAQLPTVATNNEQENRYEIIC